VHQSQQKQQQFRPPLITAIFIACLGYACHLLFGIGRSGYPWATFAGFVALFLCIKQIMRFFDDVAQLLGYRKRMKAYKKAAKEYGQSAFGTINDARAAGLLKKRGH
jgi:hypothetical protein